MSGRRSTPRRRSMLTGKVIPRCECGKAVYANGKCYAHYQDSLEIEDDAERQFDADFGHAMGLDQ